MAASAEDTDAAKATCIMAASAQDSDAAHTCQVYATAWFATSVAAS